MSYPSNPVTPIGESPAFIEVLEQASRLAPLVKPVLIIGERGTGKELIAERLHYLSTRWEAPLIKINCAALSENLLDSELFGHEAGAFTGAVKRHIGRFERAEGGTLFMDELASTSMQVQEKILRTIEYGEFERLGANSTMKSDVRVIAATNEDIQHKASKGEFRQDLLDRLAFDVIVLPPLRNRQQDILLLADAFARNMTRELDREYFAGFSTHTQEQLLQYDWPGNVRELKNVIERAVHHNQNTDQPISEIKLDPFASPYLSGLSASTPISAKQGSLQHQQTKEYQSLPAGPLDFKEHLKSYEKKIIQAALEANRHHQKRTADHLSLTYHQLRGYLKKYDLLQGSDS